MMGSGRKGFILITVIIITAAVMLTAALAFRTVARLAEERGEFARRIRLERAAEQAASVAEKWFAANATALVSSGDFSPEAYPRDDPRIAVPEAVAAILSECFHDIDIKCWAEDLYYGAAPPQSQGEYDPPRIPPHVTDEGVAERAYRINVSVHEKDNENASVRVILNMRIARPASGAIFCRRTGVVWK